MKRLNLFLLFGLLLLATPGSLIAQDSVSVANGPIELRDQHPLSLLHLTFRPQDASILPPGTYRIGSNMSWSNTFNYEPGEFRVDTETRVGDIFFRYGLTPGLEFQASQNVIWRGGGASDSLISDFHRFFHINHDRNDLVPKNEYEISGIKGDGTTFRLDRSGTGLSGLETSLKYSPSDQTAEERWAVLLGLGLPTSTTEFGQNRVDFELALYGQAGFDGIEFYSGAALLYYTDSDINNLEFPSLQYAGFLGVQYPVNSNFSLYLGGHLASILLNDVPGYPDYQTYVDFGLRSLLSKSLVLDTALRENVLHSQGTTDITLMIGLTYQQPPFLSSRK